MFFTLGRVFVFGSLLALGLLSGGWGPNAADAVAQFSARVFATIAEHAPDGRVVEVDFQLLGVRTIARGFDVPAGLLCTPDGYLYVADVYKQAIWQLDPRTGRKELLVQGKSPPPGLNFAPNFMTFDSTGNLIITTRSLFRPRLNTGTFIGLLRFRPGSRPYEAEQLLPAGAFPNANFLRNPVFLTSGPYAGDLLVLAFDARDREGTTSHVVRIPAPTFDRVEEFIPAGDHGLSRMAGIAVNPEGDVFVADFDNRRILQYAPDGTYLGVLTTLSTSYPNQIAFDSSGTMYVTATVFGAREKGALHIVYPNGSQQVIGGVNGILGLAICE